MILRISVIIVTLTIFGLAESSADTIYFTNGKSVKGRVKEEDRGKIVIETSFGDVECSSDQILDIKRGEYGEGDEIAQAVGQRYEKYGPQEVPISVSLDSKSAFVEAVLNDTTKVTLLIDTGASTIVLSKKTGEALGVDPAVSQKNSVTLELAAGRKVSAKMVMLDRIRMGGVEAKDVPAAVLLEDYDDKNVKDGLLGMSFLNKFSVKIDLKEKKMSLRKID
jgi:clan AA aspartic protease (TIGR02281 family)